MLRYRPRLTAFYFSFITAKCSSCNIGAPAVLFSSAVARRVLLSILPSTEAVLIAAGSSVALCRLKPTVFAGFAAVKSIVRRESF
jgi:hypothetical protein